jgi:hypothetical protein
MATACQPADTHVEDSVSNRRLGKKARLQVSACRAVIAGVLFFLVSQLTMRWYIDQRRPEWRDPAFVIKYRLLARQQAQHGSEPGIVLFMGSSITAGGMNPDLCEARLASASKRPVVVFNFGVMCGGPFTQLVYVQRLLRRGVRPELVVLELSPISMDFDEFPMDAGYFPGYVLEHADLATVRRYSGDEQLDEEWGQAVLVPIYGHRLAIMNHVSKSMVAFPDQLDLYKDITPHGWRKREPASQEEHARALAWVKDTMGPRMAKYRVGKASRQALDEVVALLTREKIPTLLVRAPEGPLLRSFYSAQAKAELKQVFRELSERHKLPLVDCSEWLEEDCFSDSYHMTRVGAEKLTTRLMNQHIVSQFLSQGYAARPTH